jgi:hypothetical protein
MIIGLAAVAGVSALAWLVFPDLAETQPRESDPPLTLNAAVVNPGSDDQTPDPAAQPASDPPSTEPLGRLKISRQSFSRGGLGSKALMTFTVRNRNAYAVKDLELLCRFQSKDGSFATERRRTLRETIDTRSRKVFPRTLVGFVDVRAAKAKCALLGAARA